MEQQTANINSNDESVNNNVQLLENNLKAFNTEYDELINRINKRRQELNNHENAQNKKNKN